MNLIKNRLWRVLLVMAALVGLWGVADDAVRAEAAAQASHEVNFFRYETYTYGGRNWLRVELGLSGGSVEYSADVKEMTPKQLHVVLQDTSRGDVKSDFSLDRKIAKYLTMRDNGGEALDVMISLNKPVADQAYKIYFAGPERHGKKPYRMVIEIAENKLAGEYEAEKPKTHDSFGGLSGRRIVLDPGHGGSDSGAKGHNGLMEKTATLAISSNVADILRSSGAVVTMTRDGDRDVYGPWASDRNELQARVNVGNASPDNEIFVSIHCDAFTSPSAHGTSTFYYGSSYRGKLLAEAIHQSIVEATGLASRGAKTANFYVLKNSAMPATLIETAFISNYHEEALLGDPGFQHKIAVAICRGISQYFKMR